MGQGAGALFPKIFAKVFSTISGLGPANGQREWSQTPTSESMSKPPGLNSASHKEIR